MRTMIEQHFDIKHGQVLMGLIEIRQLDSLARHKIENSRAQSGHEVTWGTVGAQLRHS